MTSADVNRGVSSFSVHSAERENAVYASQNATSFAGIF